MFTFSGGNIQGWAGSTPCYIGDSDCDDVGSATLQSLYSVAGVSDTATSAFTLSSSSGSTTAAGCPPHHL